MRGDEQLKKIHDNLEHVLLFIKTFDVARPEDFDAFEFYWKKLSESVEPLLTRELKTHLREDKKILCLETGIIYDTVKDAAIATKTSAGNIWSVLIGNSKTAKGKHWRFVE